MYAQDGGNGATSGGRDKDVSNHEEDVATEIGYFNINLNRANYGQLLFIALSTNNGRCNVNNRP